MSAPARPAPVSPAPAVDIMEHMGLVYACASRLRGRGVEYEDLVQNGCVGLLKAARGFEPSRGLRFSTYAVPVILGEMKRLFRDGQPVKVGRSCQELARKVARAREDIELREDRSPTMQELCERTGGSPEQVAEALLAGQTPLSLTVPEEGGQFDLPVDSEEEAILDRLGLCQALGSLSPGDRRLLRLRYERGMTQAAAGRLLGMTQVQVSRREKRVIEALRASF